MTTFDADIRVASSRDSANAPIPAVQVGLWPGNKQPTKYPPFRIEITDQDGLVHFEFLDADYNTKVPLKIWILTGEDPPENATVIDAASHSWTPAKGPSYARNILVDYPAPDNEVFGKV